MNNSAKCLVTGATGYLGTVLVKTLHERGYRVASLAMLGENTDYISEFSEIVYGDVCDSGSLETIISDCDYVLHLAGIINISSRNRALMHKVNVGGTRNVSSLCAKYGIKMVYCSSVHALPTLPNEETIVETEVFSPDSVIGAYSKTKAEATRLVLDMSQGDLNAMVAFPSGIVGPFERRLSNIGNLISDFLCGGLKAYIDGKYNFVDVRDVADGLCAMLSHWSKGECYILSGHVITVEEMISAIAKASGMKMLRIKIPFWLAMGTSYFSEVYYAILKRSPLYTRYSLQTLRSNCNFSNKKAMENIGFTSRPIGESLGEMTEWIRDHFIVTKNTRLERNRFCE